LLLYSSMVQYVIGANIFHKKRVNEICAIVETAMYVVLVIAQIGQLAI
jgi:hypothetical protein